VPGARGLPFAAPAARLAALPAATNLNRAFVLMCSFKLMELHNV